MPPTLVCAGAAGNLEPLLSQMTKLTDLLQVRLPEAQCEVVGSPLAVQAPEEERWKETLWHVVFGRPLPGSSWNDHGNKFYSYLSC